MRIAIFFCLLTATLTLNAQLDTVFWFAVPNGVNVSSVYFRFSTLSQAANVTISQPANPGFVPQTLSIPEASSMSYTFSNLAQLENQPANTVVNYGIKITATKGIFAYYEVPGDVSGNGGADIFALKGKNALGNEFYVTSQNVSDNLAVGGYPSYNSFAIVATEDNTTVQITPSSSVVGHAAGVQYSITLNKGQTYSAQATSSIAANHLSGSHVVSDKPVAVTVSDDNVSGSPVFGSNGADLCGDQIVSMENIGTEYIPINGNLLGNYSEHDQLFIVGTVNNTNISANGTLLTTINAGQTYRYSMGTAGAAYIQATEPVYALQLSGFGYELGVALLPSINCTGSKEITLFRSDDRDLYLTLLVDSGGVDDFLFNGTTGIITPADFSSVPGTNNQWKYAKKLFSLSQIPNGSTFTVSNTTHVFHEGIIHGDASTYCRFGYFSDFGNSRYIISANDDVLCQGDTLHLDANVIEGATYTWTLDGNVVATNQYNYTINNVTTSNGGQYVVSGSSPSCDIINDTINILVNPRPEISVLSDTVCDGETASLQVNGVNGGTVLWDYNNSTSNPLDVVLAPGLHNFTVIGKDLNGCLDTTSASVLVGEIPEVSVSTEPVCVGDNATLTASGAVSYLWSTGSSVNPLLINALGPQEVTVTGYSALGCSQSETISLSVLECYLNIPNIITPNGDGRNDFFVVNGINVFQENEVLIYNRWGKIVYKADNYRNDWDGGGNADGTYFYVITAKSLNSKLEYHGTLTIMR